MKPQVTGNNFKPVGFYTNSWEVQVAAGTTPEDLEKYEFWVHVAEKLRAYDRVYVVCEDGSFWAELLAIDASPRVGAKMKVINFANLDESDKIELPKQADEYEIKHMGFGRWSVIRKSDKIKIVENLGSKEDAVLALKQHLVAMNR